MCPIHKDEELRSVCCGASLVYGDICAKCRDHAGEGECWLCEDEKEERE